MCPVVPKAPVVPAVPELPYVFPIVGGRKVEQLQANIKALDVVLSEEQITFLEGVIPFDRGFPHGMVVSNVALGFM